MRSPAWSLAFACVSALSLGCVEASAPRAPVVRSLTAPATASPIRDVLQLASLGGPGSAPGRFREPAGIVVGPGGRIYVADAGNHRVQVLDRSGAPLTTLGSFGWDIGEFDVPHALALSPVRRSVLYIADRGSRRVQGCDVLNALYRPIVAAGDDIRLDPSGLAVGRRNEVYIADAEEHRILRVSIDGEVEWTRGQFGDALDQLNRPAGLALDGSGGMLVADAGNHRLVRMDFAGNAVAAWRPDGLGTPGAVAWSGGRWFVCDVERGGVVVVSAAGATETIIARADVRAPGGVAATEDIVFVTDRVAHDIKRYRIELRAAE